MAADPVSLPWRTGRHFPRHVYAQTGGKPSYADPYVGTLESAELAARACAVHNDQLTGGGPGAKARNPLTCGPEECALTTDCRYFGRCFSVWRAHNDLSGMTPAQALYVLEDELTKNEGFEDEEARAAALAVLRRAVTGP